MSDELSRKVGPCTMRTDRVRLRCQVSENEHITNASDDDGATFPYPSSGLTPCPEAGRFHPGDQIGPYTLLNALGEGGFGIVYLAEQKEPIRRKVALKVIKLGMDTHQVIARFEAERQALALMDHPGIAKVLDAGSTETGQPYFVMELVTGVSITKYCDKKDLGAEDRLALFVQVCNAVQHAHTKGIIHRDIKPSNVMVTQHDATPVPKVIDFGIAKAIDQSLTEKPFVTKQGQRLGTLAYMSPEQASQGGTHVDTRTDVYSLGVILYQLLVGKFPYDVSGSEAQTLHNIESCEPTRPSSRLGRFDADLEAILFKALAKVPDERYQSPAAFADDIRYWLEDLPVTARPVNMTYLAKKWVVRHKAPTAVAGLVAVILLSTGFIGLYSYRQAQAAFRELEHQRQVHEASLQQNQALLHESAFGLFLELWHHDDPKAQRLLLYLPDQSREHRAFRLLLDRRTLQEVTADVEKYWPDEQKAFGEFVLGEYHVKQGNHAEAAQMYSRCLDGFHAERPDEWYRRIAQARLDELKQHSEPDSVGVH
jgi:hypothetical protein